MAKPSVSVVVPLSTPAGAAILLYHRIASPETDVHRLAVSPEDFRAQASWLRDHARVMPLDELAEAAHEGAVPDGAVALTFDDGYLDNFAEASPILAEFGLPATFFLTTERLADGDYEFWWDALEHLLLSPRAGLPSSLVIDLPDGPHTMATATADDRLAAHWEIYRAIVASPADVRDEVIATLRRLCGGTAEPHPAVRRMHTSEIVQLAGRPGHAIGAHTVQHLMLPRHPAPVQRQEIEQSKRALESLLQRPVPTFAYPFGAMDDTTVDAARAAGFEAAVTCEDAAVAPAADLLRLPRREVTRRREVRFDEWMSRVLTRGSV